MIVLPDCGDSACCFAEKRAGMRTNGGCRCFDDLTTRAPDSPSGRLLRLARQLSQDRRLIIAERDEARAVVLIAASVQEVLRESIVRLARLRDEARAVARTLAGLWNQLDERGDPSDAQKDAYHTALAYPDTTKETKP